MRDVVWTKDAKSSFDSVCKYLSDEFSQKEVDAFITVVYRVLNSIIEYPEMFPSAGKRKRFRRAVITPQCSIFYQFDRNKVELLMFWDNRRNPSKRPK